MAISKWFLCGYDGIFEKNEELAFTYAKRAAATKMSTAEFAMGYFYEIGMYVPVDLQESAAWYAKAADHGNKDALGRIDSIRKNSTLSKRDHEQVAISRIKSQHGSQRGGRPDRFKQRGNPMPSIADNMVDMPDSNNQYDGVTGQLKSPGLPARPKSAAPYPEDDMAPHNGPGGPFNGQGLRGPGGGPLADQASSPFGIKPLNQGYDQGPGRGQDGMRASTSMGNMQVPAGRGQNPAGRAGVVSTGWEPQLQGQGNFPPQQQQQGGFLPPIDVGRPFDQNQGRPGQKPAPLNPNKPQPQPPHLSGPQGPPPNSRPQQPGQGYPPDPRGQQGYNNPGANRPPRSSSAMSPPPAGVMSPPQTPGYNPHAGNSSRASQRPPMQPPQHTMSSQGGHPPQHTMSSQRPTSSHTGSTHGGANSRPPSAAPSTAPSTAPSVASSAGSKKPVKSGPATFEEMGIPQTKKDDECVSQISLKYFVDEKKLIQIIVCHVERSFLLNAAKYMD